ncbi:MAG: chromosome segregation protein SMC, partial [Pelagibacteraceae bacterium]
STGAHSPSLISQGRIGALVTSKPADRRSVLEEAAGISGIHARREEAESRLEAAEANLKRADELKRQQEKQLDNLRKQAEEATKYKEISKEIKSIEAGLYYLKLTEIEKDRLSLVEKLSEQDDELSAVKIDLSHNNQLLEEENKRLAPLRDKRMENQATLQKLNLEMSSLDEEENRIKSLQIKLQKSLETLDSDLSREKSIALDASLNEKRILEEKNELLKTENELSDKEKISEKDLDESKNNLQNLQAELDEVIAEIETYIDSDKKLTRELFERLKKTVNLITASQEKYASNYGKNETIKSDSIKRRERIKNIDVELENWKNLKTNSDKMINELSQRKEKIKIEIEDNQKNPEKIATTKGQNIQNIENTKKRAEELDEELIKAEKKYNLINENLKEIQEKFSTVRESKARSEATIEGIEKRKKDLIYSIKSDLKLENENDLLSISNLNNLSSDNYPSLEKQEINLDKVKKQRDALGSVNLRADEETKKYQDEIKKMEDDRADLYSAIVKLKTSIDELNQKGREKLL